jgi:hypothetical protein
MTAEGWTAPERETVITTTDADTRVRIWTAQRKYISRLKKNPAFTLVKEGEHGSSPWAEFTIPADQWSPAGGAKRKLNLTVEQRAAAAQRLRVARATTNPYAA